jgi:MinD superfamily P-loop ATPase
MVVEVDPDKCTLCGSYCEPICIDRCPTNAVSLRDKRIVITEFLCEDCNECGYACPDKAIIIKKVTF